MKPTPYCTGRRHYQRSLYFLAAAGGRCHELPFRNPRPLLTWHSNLRKASSQLFQKHVPDIPCAHLGSVDFCPPPQDSRSAPPPGVVLKNTEKLTNLRNLTYNNSSRGCGSNGGGSHPQKARGVVNFQHPASPPPPVSESYGHATTLGPYPCTPKTGLAVWHMTLKGCQHLPSGKILSSTTSHGNPASLLLPHSLPNPTQFRPSPSPLTVRRAHTKDVDGSITEGHDQVPAVHHGGHPGLFQAMISCQEIT